MNSSALYTNLYSNTGLGELDTVGAIIWTIGFLFETVGDAQEAFFKDLIPISAILVQKLIILDSYHTQKFWLYFKSVGVKWSFVLSSL